MGGRRPVLPPCTLPIHSLGRGEYRVLAEQMGGVSRNIDLGRQPRGGAPRQDRSPLRFHITAADQCQTVGKPTAFA